MRTLAVISAGLSTPSSTRQIADSISEAVTAAVSARGEALSVSTIELSELIPDLMTAMITGVHTTKLEEITSVLSAADGLVVATPVFKASYTGLFKMFFDVLDTDALTGMPTIIAATAGSARHSLVLDYALRPLLSYMRAVVVPTGVLQLPKISVDQKERNSINESLVPQENLQASLSRNLATLVD